MYFSHWCNIRCSNFVFKHILICFIITELKYTLKFILKKPSTNQYAVSTQCFFNLITNKNCVKYFFSRVRTCQSMYFFFFTVIVRLSFCNKFGVNIHLFLLFILLSRYT